MRRRSIVVSQGPRLRPLRGVPHVRRAQRLDRRVPRATLRTMTKWGSVASVHGAMALFLTSVVPGPASARQAAPSSLVIDGVTVVDVEQGKLLPGQRVVVDGNRIRVMGDVGTVKIPSGAQVV